MAKNGMMAFTRLSNFTSAMEEIMNTPVPTGGVSSPMVKFDANNQAKMNWFDIKGCHDRSADKILRVYGFPFISI